MRRALQVVLGRAPLVITVPLLVITLCGGATSAGAIGTAIGTASSSSDPARTSESAGEIAASSIVPPETASSIAGPGSLEDYLALAALQNPGLGAAFERWKADLERIPQVRAYPDPRFNFAYYIQEVETRVGPQQARVSLSQTFPWFGKLGLRGDVAFEASEASRRRYESVKLRLFYQVKDAFHEYDYLRSAIEITRRNLQLLVDLEQIARIRYRTAATGQPDVIKAQVELGRLDDRLVALEEFRSPLAARLNALVNHPADAPIPWPEAPVWGAMLPRDAEVLSWMREGNPELMALSHKVREKETALELAGKNFFPDLTFGVNYVATGEALDPRLPDSGKDPLIATLSINLPIWRGAYRAAEREAAARLRSSHHARQDREKRLESTVKKVLFECRDAERKIDLYRDTLIPKGEQSLESTRTAFMAGHADFLDVIDAQRVLLEFELAFHRAQATHAQRLAELEMYAGRAIPVAETER